MFSSLVRSQKKCLLEFPLSREGVLIFSEGWVYFRYKGCGNSDSVPWGCHWGAGWLGCSVGTSEPFGRGLDTVALGGPPVFTSELIGEDSLAGH